MAYLGNDLQVAYQSYQIIDDISSSFNGVLTTFPLQVGGVTPVPFPINPQQCLISVNGVIQEPDPSGTSGFNLVGSNIVFSSAPTGGHAFFGVILAGADYVNVGVNYPSGSESAPSITFDTDLDTGIYNPAANELGFSTNSIQRLKIESDGDINIDNGGVFYDATNNRLAIGTTSPARPLHVNPGSGNDGSIRIDYGTGSTADGYFEVLALTNVHYLRTVKSGGGVPLAFQVNSVERTRITASGDIDLTGNGSNAGLAYGGIGARNTSGIIDWNDVSNARSGQGETLLVGSATNGPGGGVYYHPFCFEYSSKDGTGNLTQLAIGYNTNTRYMRYRYLGAWSSWVAF